MSGNTVSEECEALIVHVTGVVTILMLQSAIRIMHFRPNFYNLTRLSHSSLSLRTKQISKRFGVPIQIISRPDVSLE